MIFNFEKKDGIKINLVFEGQDIDCDIFRYLKENDIFNGKYDEIYVSGFEKAIYLGLGKMNEMSLERVREVFFHLSKELISKKISEVELDFPYCPGVGTEELASAIGEGLMQGEYRYDTFKTDRKEKTEITVNINAPKETESVKSGVEEARAIIKAVFLARDIVNLPSNHIYPETLAERAVKELSPLGVKVNVYDKEQIENMKMEAFLSVARGSDREPRLIVMEYMNDPDSKEILGLVGKGLTYDSGGYSLKPSDSMKTMFCDMGGAGTVIGAIHAIASLKAKTNVVGVIAACENLISGHAYKPGDIIGSLSGKTIEVDNTDAEGRLTLADAVYYTENTLKATKIIDLATLTGSCLYALGELYTGSVTNNQEFFNELKEASEEAGERIWQLPVDPLFAKQNDSKVADIKNVGGRLGGTITAGLFVGSFLSDDIPWIHLDIAGTAYLSSSYSYLPEGATGIHVKTLYKLAAKYK